MTDPVPPPPPPPDPAVAAAAEQQLQEAIKTHVGAYLKSGLGPALLPALDAALKPHLEALRLELTPRPPEPPAVGTSPEMSPVMAAKFAELQADNQKTARALAKEREERATERQDARQAQAFGALRSELAASGKVRPEAVDTAAELLFHARKHVKVAADGSVSFALGGADYELKEGVRLWATSDAAQIFLPAPGGTSPARRPGPPPPPRGPAPAAGVVETPLAKSAREIAERQERQRDRQS